MRSRKDTFEIKAAPAKGERQQLPDFHSVPRRFMTRPVRESGDPIVNGLRGANVAVTTIGLFRVRQCLKQLLRFLLLGKSAELECS